MALWSDELLKEYKEGRKQLRSKIAALNDEIDRDKEDIKLLESAIRDMTFTIDWLSTGIEPDGRTKRGQERAYTYSETFVYGVNGYWDESMNGFISKGSYHNQYEEVDERMDRELEDKKREAS